MRKFLIVLALLLIPAISFAGSATSRWDVTIGGYIKAEFGYADQLRAQNNAIPYREAASGYKSYGDDYGTYFSSAVQTRLNFLIKGPDVWGMKTQGFLEGDFYAGANQGDFRLRHAYLNLIGKDVTYTFGQTSQVFGTLYGTSQVLLVTAPWMGATMPVGGGRMPQIDAEVALSKEFKFLLGVFVNNNPVGTTGTGDVDSYTMGSPYVHARFMFSTDKCGKIGRDQLTALVTGFYGRDKRVCSTATGTCTAPSTSSGYTTEYKKNLDSWGLHGNLFIPVIPAKKEDKTGSVGFSVFGFIMQNPGDQGMPPNIFSGAAGVNSQTPYRRPDGSWAALQISGWGPQAYVYLTDKLAFVAAYADTKAKMSKWYKDNNPNAMEERSAYVFLLSYDPNPAVKFTFDWERDKAKFAGTATNLKKTGTVNVYRFGAYYFF